MSTLKVWFSSVIWILLSMRPEISQAAGFDIIELPLGRNVTLVKPATTIVPIATRTTLGATDLPQILKFEAIAKAGSPPAPLRVAIYDSSQVRVRYIEIKPGVPFLYSFRDLDSILVIPQIIDETRKIQVTESLKLQIESDKPLSIGR